MIITVSGHSLSGKSCVGEELAKRLKFKYYSAGDIRRKFAVDKGISLADLNKEALSNPESDKMVDNHIKEIAEKEDNFIVNGRTAYFLIPKSFKLFLDADIDVRAERLLNRDSVGEVASDPEEAKKSIEKRDSNDKKRYKKLYGIEDCYDRTKFDLLIDTSKLTVAEAVDIVIDFLKKRKLVR